MDMTWDGKECSMLGSPFGKDSGQVACLQGLGSQGKSLLVLGLVPFNLSSSLMRLARCRRLRPPLEAGDREDSSLHGTPSFQLLKGPSP